jgi:ribosomal-protein-serine acetyltransferase
MKNPLEHIKIPAVLETERLELRLLTMDMAQSLNDAIHASAEDFKPWFEWIHPKLPTLLDSQDICLTNIKEQVNKESFYFQIYMKGTETLVGRISLDKSDPCIPAFNIGYWVHSKHTGHGYMLEAAQKVCGFAINELKSKRLEIYYDTENLASEKIIMKLKKSFGFEKEGVAKNKLRRKYDGTLRHHVMYAFTAND